MSTATAPPLALPRRPRRDPRPGRARPRPPRPLHRPGDLRARAGALLRQHLELRRPREPGAERRATTSRVEIAGRPLVAVRHDDGSVRVLMNRCAHKGARVVSAPAGNTGKFFRCPYHAWAYNTDGSLRAIPLKSGYDGTRLAECEAAQGLAPVRHVRSYRGFVFCKLSDAGPDFDELLRRLAHLDRQPRRPLARRRARDRRRLPALPAQLQLEDVRREPERHDAPDGRARVVGRHREDDVEGQAGRQAQADGDRAVRAVRLRLQVLRRHGRARLRQRPQLLGRELLDPQRLLGESPATRRRCTPPTAPSAAPRS